MLEFCVDVEFGFDDLCAGTGLCQKTRQAVIALRTDHQIDNRCAAGDFLTLRLGDATGDADHHVLALTRPLFLDLSDTAEFGIDLFGSLFPDMAGVQDHQIRVFQIFRRLIALRRQRVGHALAVIDIHLTAIGPHKDLLCCRSGVGRLAGLCL
jgi:hypothetical protein